MIDGAYPTPDDMADGVAYVMHADGSLQAVRRKR